MNGSRNLSHGPGSEMVGGYILRAIIYSALSFLVIVTSYLYYKRSVEESGKDETLTRPNKTTAFIESGAAPSHGKPVGRMTDTIAPVEVRISAGAEADVRRQTESDRLLAVSAAEKLKTGDYEGAAKLFDELSGRDKRALTGAGVSWYKLGDYERARSALEKAVELDGNDFVARKFLAFVYDKKDDIEKSLYHADFGLSLSKDPELRSLADALRKERRRGQVINESTSHFKIIFDGYAHGELSRKVIGILEDAYSTVGKEFGFFPSEPVTVILYTNRDFHDITQAPEWSTGVFDGKIRIPVRGSERSEVLLKKVLFHEYAHTLVHSLTPRCPLWINEGIAEYFSAHYPEKTGQVIPLHSLEQSFAWLPGDKVGLAYWESCSAVSYLVDRYGVYRLKDLLVSLSKGTQADDAFRQTFGVSYREFLSAWGKQ
ncbi:MAG TPA: tetratricopeptide repeat protein [Thermodesulfovibrionales bacterium]|nr:tetratricopeptide repeat protein [Thermodesulfovibrionales bacterium]